jgi:hypothetical protein
MIDVGLEWHPKMLFRVELTGTMINAYNTRLNRLNSSAEVDYWLGGLVAGGIGPQLWDAKGTAKGTPFDEQIARWMRLYVRYGHAVEGGVRTLQYDAKCCHIQGSCEWVACRDVIASRLAGGALDATETVGAYVGAPDAVALPVANGSATLVFQARGVAQSTLGFGAAADTHFAFIALSAARLVLSGAFWELSPSQEVVQTVRAANGSVLSRALLGGGGTTLDLALGQRADFEKREKISGRRAFYTIFAPMLDSPDWPSAYEQYRGGLIIMNPFNATREIVQAVQRTLDAKVVMYWDTTDLKIKTTGECAPNAPKRDCDPQGAEEWTRCSSGAVACCFSFNCSAFHTPTCLPDDFARAVQSVADPAWSIRRLPTAATPMPVCFYGFGPLHVHSEVSNAALVPLLAGWVQSRGFDGIYLDEYFDTFRTQSYLGGYPNGTQFDATGDGKPDQAAVIEAQYLK